MALLLLGVVSATLPNRRSAAVIAVIPQNAKMSGDEDIEPLEGALGNISLLLKKRVDNLTKREEEFE